MLPFGSSHTGKSRPLANLRLFEMPKEQPLVLFDPHGPLAWDLLQKIACSPAPPPDDDPDDCDDPRWVQAWNDYLRRERGQGHN